MSSDPLPEEPRPGRVVLLSHDRRWMDAVRAATARLGYVLQIAPSAETVMALLAGMHGVGRLLLDPQAAGPSAAALVEMTCGEVESGVDVIMLGHATAAAQCLAEPDVDAIAAALASPDPFCYEWPGRLPLEVAQVLQAMQDGRVRVRFQPIVSVHDRSLIAFEVLARLHGTTCGTLPPHRFVPQLEQAGFGADLLRSVTEAAFGVAGQLAGARLALNLPLSVLNDRRTMDMLTRLREQAGVPAVRILLELTETEVVDNVALLDPVIERWREQGYAVAIDDAGPHVPRHRDMFGLSFDWVKLDKSVVSEAIGSPSARRYMADTVASAHRAKLSVIAEGIETQATWDLVRELGVDCGQGFMIARPLPADVVPVWRRAWAAGGTAGSQFPA